MGEIFCVMPNDSCYLCRCPECLPHFKGSTAGNYTQETTDYIWKFMSGIAQRVKDAGIPGYVTTMAYSQYRGIPSFSLPDNMIVMLAVTGPWNEGKSQQKKDERLLRDWQKKLNGKTYLWTYPSKYWVSVRGIPNMAPQASAISTGVSRPAFSAPLRRRKPTDGFSVISTTMFSAR